MPPVYPGFATIPMRRSSAPAARNRQIVAGNLLAVILFNLSIMKDCEYYFSNNKLGSLRLNYLVKLSGL